MIVAVALNTVATLVVPEEYVHVPASGFPSAPVTFGGVSVNAASPYVFVTGDHVAIDGVAWVTVIAPDAAVKS